ncbi:MAG TPA: alpha/beta fold hydrolase [Geopsychrobacteraceae bacterium]|nr:alpha/beta fold hydrolase [Geopsychrobacteraceae bacterium]
MKSLRIRFPNAEGLNLAARLDLPQDEKPIAYALFAHCFTCTKNIKAAVNIAAALNREKIAVLRFDFTGLGQSEGEFSETNFSTNVADLVAAAQHLEREYQGPQILIGHSLGGAAVLQAAHQIPSVRAIATIGAPHDPKHVARNFEENRLQIEQHGEAEVNLAGRHFTIKKQFLEDLEMQHLDDHIRTLKSALLVMHSPRDTTVGIDNAAKIYQAARHPKSFISLDEADHLLLNEDDSLYAARMIAVWSRRYLNLAETAGIEAEVTDNRVTVSTAHDGFFTELFANHHALVADEPTEYGGTDRGPTPYDYLLAALGSCTSMTLQMYARLKKIPLQKAIVRLSHEKIHARDCAACQTENGKIDRMEREVELVGELTAEQRQRLLQIADRCPVHKTLHGDVEVVTRIKERN